MTRREKLLLGCGTAFIGVVILAADVFCWIVEGPKPHEPLPKLPAYIPADVVSRSQEIDSGILSNVVVPGLGRFYTMSLGRVTAIEGMHRVQNLEVTAGTTSFLGVVGQNDIWGTRLRDDFSNQHEVEVTATLSPEIEAIAREYLGRSFPIKAQCQVIYPAKSGIASFINATHDFNVTNDFFALSMADYALLKQHGNLLKRPAMNSTVIGVAIFLGAIGMACLVTSYFAFSALRRNP